jgi:acetate kinase
MVEHTNILTVNTGSSSLKVALFSVDPTTSQHQRIFELSMSDIGQPLATIKLHKASEDERTIERAIPDHAAAITLLVEMVSSITSPTSITAVGYRVVHGGPDFSDPVRITDAVIGQLERLAPLDPHHTPASLHLIRELRRALPNVPHVACFDTAFSHDIPRVAQIVPIPNTYQDIGVRRYGFHGLSYSYLQSAFEERAGSDAVRGRVIYAHLGSGASLAATREGKPIDMTMGLTPASGVMMSTRAGDLDPSLPQFLSQQTDMDLAAYDHMVNYESGLLGVSGLTSDMHALIGARTTNPQAAEAIDVFCYDVKKAIGALAATIGGLDSLVFSGGIGEQAPLIRAQICEGLGYMGVALDSDANQQNSFLISSPWASVGVHVIPTDEAVTISRQVLATIATESQGGTV